MLTFSVHKGNQLLTHLLHTVLHEQTKDGKHPGRTRGELETAQQKEHRLQHAANRKIRRLSGWNIFVKMSLEGQSLSPDEYKHQMNSELPRQWQTMSQDDRDAFHTEAARQEELRFDFANTPFEAGQENVFSTEIEKEIGRNSAKLFSARRLLLNESQYENHAIWKLPTCLGDSNGALKSHSIDIASRDDDIERKLNLSVHRPLEPTEFCATSEGDNTFDVHEAPCFSYMCSNDENTSRVKQLVKELSWGLKGHNVMAGMLLLFSIPDYVGFVDIPCLLGVTMSKPIFHMLAMVSLNDSEISLTRSISDLPQFQSSHELILNLLRAHSPDPESVFTISVEVWQCDAFLLSAGGKHILKSNPKEVKCRFNISSKPKPKKPSVTVKLPFGMIGRRNKRKKQPKPSQSSKKVKKPGKKQRPKTGQACLVDNESSVSTGEDGGDASESDSGGENVVDLPASSSGRNHGDQAELLEVEEEKVVPMSNVVAIEQFEAMKVADEVAQDDATLANAFASQKENSSSVKTAFSSVLGLSECSEAKSGRSVCFRCKQKIKVNSIRYSWFHSKVKPPAWVHNHCIFAVIQSSMPQVKQDSIEKVKQLIEENCGTPHVFCPLREDCQKLLSLLQPG
eukprot:Skav203811  [mRNA]  locus=scaffold1236:353221:355548:+ [translate_table: standard]